MSKLRAEVLGGHGGALQVPAGPARAPGGVPRRLARLRRLPHREVAGVALAGRVRVGGREHLVDALAAQRAVAGEAAHVEVDVALGRVAVPGVDEPLHERDHLGHVPGGARLVGGRQAAEHVVGARERALVAHGDVPVGDAVALGVRDDLVVDVGDVADEGDVVPARGQPAADDVEGDAAADVAHVRRGLHGRPAQVDARLAVLDGDEVPDGARRSVVEAEGHGSKSTDPSWTARPSHRGSGPEEHLVRHDPHDHAHVVGAVVAGVPTGAGW